MISSDKKFPLLKQANKKVTANRAAEGFSAGEKQSEPSEGDFVCGRWEWGEQRTHS